jgi:hypothetical protein
MLNTIHMKFFIKMQELEKERNEVMANPEFQNWMKELGISSMCEDRSTKIKAKDLQMQYDTKLYSKLNFNL